MPLLSWPMVWYQGHTEALQDSSDTTPGHYHSCLQAKARPLSREQVTLQGPAVTFGAC